MVDTTQTVFAVGVPTLAVLIGILVNNSRLGDLNSRLGDLREYMDSRFTGIDRRLVDMEALFTEKLLRVEQVMDARLKHLEENR
jgi:hypothetical protein